jgi:peptidoglycan-associated lipoprotein
MKTMTGILAAFIFGLGCSHAKPKTETPATALAAPPRTTPPPSRRENTEDTSSAQARANAGSDSIYFDFDSALIKPESRSTLQEVGKELIHNQKKVRIEGNCDERGTTEYNIALGEERAREAESYLERLGIPGRRISVVSYGSERPKASGHDEAAWAQNRRDDFRIQ